MADPDIVTRLRESDGGYFMRQMFTEAADEIERLREELEDTKIQLANMEEDYFRIRNNNE